MISVPFNKDLREAAKKNFLMTVPAEPGNIVIPATASACFTNPGCELSAECDSFKVV